MLNRAVIRHREAQKFPPGVAPATGVLPLWGGPAGSAGKRGIAGHGTGQGGLVAPVYRVLFYGLIV